MGTEGRSSDCGDSHHGEQPPSQHSAGRFRLPGGKLSLLRFPLPGCARIFLGDLVNLALAVKTGLIDPWPASQPNRVPASADVVAPEGRLTIDPSVTSRAAILGSSRSRSRHTRKFH